MSKSIDHGKTYWDTHRLFSPSIENSSPPIENSRKLPSFGTVVSPRKATTNKNMLCFTAYGVLFSFFLFLENVWELYYTYNVSPNMSQIKFCKSWFIGDVALHSIEILRISIGTLKHGQNTQFYFQKVNVFKRILSF